MYYIEDFVMVHKGIKLDNNEDNIYINKFMLPEKNDGLKNYKLNQYKLTNNLIYGIFDGIGGLSQGERASYLVVSTIRQSSTKIKIKEILNKANNKILMLKKENDINLGTTASIVSFNNKKINLYMVGDSTIYIYSNNQLYKYRQQENENNKLDNYIGIENMKIKEEILTIHNNDKILICSDGLTNEVGDNEIEYILSSSDNIEYITNKLLNLALNSGGRDNISIITLRINKNYKELLIVISIALIICLFIYIYYFIKLH